MIVGDGGMAYALEKRGYVRAGPFSPECVLESPEAGTKQLHISIAIISYFFSFPLALLFYRSHLLLLCRSRDQLPVPAKFKWGLVTLNFNLIKK